MSGDSKELEVQEEVEETLVDLLTKQGEEGDEEETVVPEGELPEDFDGMKALLLQERGIKTKRNRSLKKSKDANHRIQGELEAALTRIEKLETSGAAQQPNLEAGNRDRYEKDLEKWRKSVEDEPGKAVDFANWQAQTLQTNMTKAMTDMKAEIVAQLAEIKGNSNPDHQTYKAEMELVASLPEYEGASKSEILRAAKLLKGTKVKSPRGTASGKTVAKATSKKSTVTAADKRKMGFDVED